MATEAQVVANRANARKSTGPRTPEGKAIVARNAVKHGLLGEQIIVEGEDRLHFAFQREEMMKSLSPVGEVEISLAERLVGLSWRLQRIERLQVQAFEALCATAVESPADENSDEKLALGRIIVKDFSEARVLDKLLVYERRIEHSLCRVLGELRRERLFQNLEARTQDDGNPQVLLERLMRKLGPSSPTSVLRTGPGWARWEETEEVSGEDTAGAGPRACPAGGRPQGAAPTQVTLPDSAAGLLRQTNPIAGEPKEGQILDNKGVSSGAPQSRPGKTKPIGAAAEASGCVAASCDAAKAPATAAVGG